MVSDQKIFNHDSLNDLGRGSPEKHSYQVILKSVHWFLTRRFCKFSIQIYRENEVLKVRHILTSNT